jgi:hypothetical protein
VRTASGEPNALDQIRRQNWIAITLATIVMMVSYFSYAAAFVDDTSGERTVEPAPAVVGLAIAPFVFIVLGFVSRNARAPKRVLGAMGLLVAVGLAVGLLDPLVGAATGFCLGGAIVLNRPDVERLMFWRYGAVVFTSFYMLVLLVVAVPAAVFTGAILPLMMIGFADEYAAWSAGRATR